MSMFSFFSANKSPSNSNISAQSDAEEAKSSFSFMTSGNESGDPSSQVDGESGSGFNFMSSSVPATQEDQGQPTSGSGFSFLNSGAAESSSETTSSFSFMAQTSASADEQVKDTTPMNSPPQKDLMSMEVQQSEDVKLAKVASNKVVKKKKKATRVGFGRDDEDEDVTPAPSVTTTPHITQGPVEVPTQLTRSEETTVSVSTASTNHPVDTNDDLDLPPVPPPGYRPDTPTNRESLAAAADPSLPSNNVGESETTSMFSGFNFVNNNVATVNNAVNEAESSENVAEISANTTPSSGFNFLSSTGADTTTASKVESTPVNQPGSSFSFLSAAATTPTSQDIPEVKTASNEQEFGVPTDILQTLQTESRKLSQSIQGFVNLYNGAYDLFTRLMTEVIQSSQTCTDLTDKIDQLEQQQTELAEREEFEQAAVISAEIESIQSQLAQKMTEKEQALDTLRKVKAEYDLTRPSVTAAFSTSFDSVFTFVAAAKEVDVQGRKTLDDYVQEENDRLSVEEQRIQMEKSHCEREQTTLQSESAVVEEAINTQVGDQLEKKRDLEVQAFSVQEEIRRLEEQLAVKRAEEVDISKQIKQIDNKILEVRKKYERQLARIAERRDALTKAQHECALEEQIVNDNRQRVESVVSSALESYRILSIQADTKQQEVKLAETFMQDVNLSLEQEDLSFSLDFSWYITESDEIYRCFSAGDHLSSSSKDLSDQVSKIEQSIRQKDKSIDEKKSQKEVAHMRLKSLVDTIDRLEVEKKGHAANKRFKEAANTAKELKEAGEAKEQVEKEIKELHDAIDGIEEAKQQASAELQIARNQLREEQKAEKLIHYNIVRRRMRTCERIKRKIESVVASHPSDFTQTLLDLYEREFDRLYKIRTVLVRECDIDESTLPPDTIEEVEEVAEKEGVADDVAAVSSQEDGAAAADELTTVLASEEEIEDNEVNTDLIAESSANEEPAEVAAATAEEEAVIPPEPQIDREAILAQISELEKEMEQAADAEDYDQAAVLMDKITELKTSIGIND